MKKTTILASVIAGVLVIGGGSVYAARQIARSNAISEENACNFAYVDAGVSPEDTTVNKIEFDFENGKFVYEIEFVTDDMEYEYTVDSASGKILSRKSEKLQEGSALQPSGSSTGSASASDPVPGGADQTNIGVEAAKEIALKRAGLSASDVTFSKAKLDRDSGRDVYDIEFYIVGKAEYDYEIDAATGEILEEGFEEWTLEDYYEHNLTPPSTEPDPGSNPPAESTVPATEPDPGNNPPVESTVPAADPGNQTTQISLEEAKAIALRRAGLTASEVTFSKTKLDRDHNRDVYEIEFFVVGKAEYDYEIDALTGDILEEGYDGWTLEDYYEHNLTPPSTQTNPGSNPPVESTVSPAGPGSQTNDIGLEEAKAIALRRAGLSASDVVFSKAKLDRDDGRLVYEIEFYVRGQMEYEYEIDAATGTILEEDSEPWEADD